MRAASLYIRVLAAWLIAMQPLIGAYATIALAATAPLAMELCRGAPAPAGAPASFHDHAKCCLAASSSAASSTPDTADIAAPGVHTADVYLPLAAPTLSRAELSPRSARAPPA